MKICIQISDPWDLGEFIGWKPIIGEIISFSQNEEKVLVKLINPIKIIDKTFNYVVYSVKFQSDKIKDLLNGNTLCGSGVGISDSQYYSTNPFANTWRGGGLAFIGSLNLIDEK